MSRGQARFRQNSMRPPALLFFLLLLVAGGDAWAAGKDVVVLTYQGDHKWVAPEENAGLRKLLGLARSGKHQFGVRLPAEERELAVSRLVVVRDLLAREAKHGVVLREADKGGHAPVNTVEVWGE